MSADRLPPEFARALAALDLAIRGHDELLARGLEEEARSLRGGVAELTSALASLAALVAERLQPSAGATHH